MRYRILGSLTVLGPDGRTPAFERRHGRILAVLLLSPNQLVGRDYLIDAVWDETPPATAARQLQNCISTLRQQLPGGDGWKHAIVAERAGYRINLDDGELDAQVFASAVAEATKHQAAGDFSAATTGLRAALALWQGPALAGMTGRAIEAGSARLNEHRLTTLEDCLDLELRQGRYRQTVAELMELVAANPLRERMVALLMRALQGAGRQNEALTAYDNLRHKLADELGLDPSSELRQLHAQILRHSAPPPPAGPVTVAGGQTALRQLPAPVRHFVGREPALDELDRVAAAAGRDALMIAVIHGTGGIGKTALAIRWAHRAAARFPDGQLFINLRGFHPAREPMTPAEAVRAFLEAFAVAAEQIPVSLDGQANLYRTLLAERRVLIVLDNARDVEQVRPLLPGGSGCMVVITSRSELTGLVAVEGAHPVTLGLLTRQEAHHLLASHLGQARLDAEPEAVAELVTRCAQLPLALAIIAARAAAHPTFPLATFSAELADTQRRLDAVDGGDQFSQVRSVFSWSYQRLSTQAAQLFRLLGLHRGTDITVPAAANLAGIPSGQARQLLGDLARAHMVTEHLMGRYTLHDLLSAYAAEQARTCDGETERGLAVRRLLSFSLHAAAAADTLVTPHRRRTPLPDGPLPSDLPRFCGHAEALAWLENERGNLVAAVHQACAEGENEIGWRMANLLWGLFHLEKHWEDWVNTHLVGLRCARACGSGTGEFTMLSSLGTAHRELSRYDDALSFHRQALQLSARNGDRHGEAQALNGIGAVYGDLKVTAKARQYMKMSLEIRREIGDRWGEAITICNLGVQDLDDGLIDSARSHFLAALAIRREIGDRWGEGIALTCLGRTCLQAGDLAEAVSHLREALEIHRETRDYAMEALGLHQLGLAHHSLGQHDLALGQLREARAIYERLRMPEATELETEILAISGLAL